MKFILCCCIFRLVYLINKSNKYVNEGIVNFFGSYYIFMDMGYKSQSIFMEVNMLSDSVIFGKKFDSSITENSKKVIGSSHIIGPDNQTYETQVFEDFFTFKDSLIHFHNLYYNYLFSNFYMDTFPLGYNITDNNFSIIHYLKKQDFIEHLGFGFHKGVNGKISLYFGNFSDEVLKGQKFVHSCKIPNDYNNWGCKLKRVIINAYIYNNEDKMHFQSNDENFQAPVKFMDFLNKTLFLPYLKNGSCYTNETQKFGILMCKPYVTYFFPEVIFEIGNYRFNFSHKTLFHESNANDWPFFIRKNLKNPKEWEIGNMFLANYLTFFSFDKNEILFYSNRTLLIQYNDYKKNIIILLVLIPLVLLFNCVVLFINYLFINK